MWEYESPLLLCPATCRSLKLNRFHVQCRGIQMNLIKNGEVEICATNGIRTNTRYTIDLRSVQQSPPFVWLRSICAKYCIFLRKMQLETRLNSFFLYIELSLESSSSSSCIIQTLWTMNLYRTRWVIRFEFNLIENSNFIVIQSKQQ